MRKTENRRGSNISVKTLNSNKKKCLIPITKPEIKQKTWLDDIATLLKINVKDLYFDRMGDSYSIAIKESKTGRYISYDDENEIAGFEIEEFPGCCGIAVITNLRVDPKYTKKGLGTLISKIALVIAYKKGYRLAVATDKTKNVASMRIFEKGGWDLTTSFINMRTKNKISVFSHMTIKSTKPLGFII